MSVNIRVRIDPHGTVRYIKEMERRAVNFVSVFHWAKREIEKANAANFTSNGLPVGGWSPLKPKYAAWKAVHFPGTPTLVQDGTLFRSLTNINGSDSRIRATTAEFGTSVKYAKFHQYGTTKMAKRQIVFEPPLFAKALADKAAKHIVGRE